ncbi:MAG: diguanylate cyclase, partial [Smithella sp.]
ISGKTDPANSLFTKGGSFWINDSFPLLDLSADHDPRLNPRNKCIHQGYASVALVPIRTKDQIVGLMQFNDLRKNSFFLADIEQFESIAANIGEALLRKDAEKALAESEERYRFLTDHTADHIWTMDLSLRFIYSSPAVMKILGYTVSEFLELAIDQFFTAESFAMAEKLLAEELETDKDPSADPNRIRTLQTEHCHKNGHMVWLESSLTFIRDASMRPTGILGVSRDITERKKAEEQIKHLATHDLLTDLPSLRLAKDRMSVAINMARRYKKAAAVMFIDLDGFKAVNDTLGHDAGDYVLVQVAKRLLSCVRETDTVARVGGDEFLIIATEINTPDNAAQIAEKVIQLVSKPVFFKGQKTAVGASIGIALYPDHGEDMDQLIKLADEAMYKVKNAGKNGFCFVNTSIK